MVLEMKYFCSKDCPDSCIFEAETGGKFKAIPNSFDKIPFYCSKLPKYYAREMKDTESFYVENGEKNFVDHKRVAELLGKFLKENRYKNILFLRGSGSLGYRMGYWNKLFSNFENCYFVDDNPCDETGVLAHMEDFGCCTNPPLENLESVDNIFNFGRNAKVTNQHLYAYLKDIKKEMIYFDPILSETAPLGDRYVRVEPATDGIIAALICKELSLCPVDADKKMMLDVAKIDEKLIKSLASKIVYGKTAFITGFGLQRYKNGKNAVQWINRLAYYTGNIDNLYYGRPSKSGLSGISYRLKNKLKIYEAYEKMKNDFFDIVVVVASNPCVTYPEVNFLREFFSRTKLAVIDTNNTVTSDFADFFIKVGGMFCEEDTMGSYFFDVPVRKRGRLEKKFLSDTDVVKVISDSIGVDLEIKGVEDLEFHLKDLKRVPHLENISVLMPQKGGNFRILTISHPLYLNSQLVEGINTPPDIFITQEDAEYLKLTDGAFVEISNENGRCFGKIKITDKVANGYVMLYKSQSYKNGTQNMLTPCIPTDARVGVSYYDTFGQIILAK